MNSACPGLTETAAFVMAGGSGERLRPLTDRLPKPLLPFGGVFRILDFTLSNCRNSGIPFVGVLSQHESRQIGRHLRRVWAPAAGDPEFVHLPPVSGKRYRGTADAVRQNLDLALDRGARHALILSADHVYQADYRDLLRSHRDSGADVTVSAVRVPVSEGQHFGVLNVDGAGVITGFEEKPARPSPLPDDPGSALASMGVYVFGTDMLIDALESEDGRLTDFGRDILPRLVGRRRIVASEFKGAGGSSAYWRDLGTFDGYRDAHMDLLDGRSGPGPFSSSWPIVAADPLTAGDEERLGRLGDSPADSIIPGGAWVEGCIERSVVSPGVWIEKGADVRHSILMHGVHVGRGAEVRRALVAEGIRIPPGTRIGYDAEADRARFHVTESGLAVVNDPAVFAEPHPAERVVAARAAVRTPSLVH